MKVLLARRFPAPIVESAASLFDVDVHESDRPMDEAARIDALGRYDGILATLGDRYSAATFASAGTPRTRVIANFGVGYDHIDAAAACARGITVTHTPGVLTDATADIAMTLMLMAARRAGEGERMVRAGAWPGWAPTQLLGQDVSGATLGIIGFGRIGQAMARKAHHGFGMRIVYFNRSPKEPGFPAERKDSIEALCAVADVVAVHAPGGNTHLVRAEHFSAMKPTAVFVNTARGDVVDETALIAALERSNIFAAGLDVYAHEPVVPDALRALDNVVLLPHLGSASMPVRLAMGHMALANIAAALGGKDSPNKVPECQ